MSPAVHDLLGARRTAVADELQRGPGDDRERHDWGSESGHGVSPLTSAHLFVGETAITDSDIAREMQCHPAPTPQQSWAAAARALVVRELLRREVERLGLATQACPIGSESTEEACIRRLMEREVADRKPDEDDCRRYYERNRNRFRSPDRIRVCHILLAAPSDDVKGRSAARREAERLIGELRVNLDLFAEFAVRSSRCPSKDQGGCLGWLQRGQTTPEFDRQIFRLGRGLAACPIESRWGYHVVNIEELQPGEALGFEVVHERISDYLELQARQCELLQYLRGLQQRYGVRGLEAIEAQAT